MPKVRLSHSSSTWSVLCSVWDVVGRLKRHGQDRGATIQDVHEHLLDHGDRPLNQVTVATYLRRLQDKGVIQSTKEGKRLYYSPVVPEDLVVAREIRHFLNDVVRDRPEHARELQRQLDDRLAEAQVHGTDAS